jgi:capsular exopolysaccharide synthesis family protein
MVGSDAIPTNEIAAINSIAGSLKVSRVAQQGYVVSISITSPDPVRAAQLANAVSDAYLVDKLDTRFEAAKRASAWLSDRLVGLREQLRQSEEAVEQFRAEHGLVQSGNITLNQQQLSELNGKLIDARADLAQKKARLDLVSSLQAKGSNLQNMPDIANAGALPTLRQQASALSAQEADLLARYGASHPLVVNIRAQERDVERTISTEVQRLAASVRSDYELAQARVASLEKSLQQATGQTNTDEATAIRMRELERTAAVNKTLFEDFLKQAKITEEQATFEPQDVRVITPAFTPTAPSYPEVTRGMVVSLFIGLFIGVGGALTKEKLDTGFTTPKQIEDLMRLPVLTSVSEVKPRELRVNGSTVPIYNYPIAKPLSRYGESIRSLRSGIHMTDVDHPPKVIQITSAVPREGKTTIGLSLAASAASAKLKVLFIDADLRHPTATRIFGLQKEVGLVDLLLGEASMEDVIRFREKEGYWVLAAGSKTQNPADLLESERMKSMVAGFKEAYDFVVLDTSPIGPVIDAVVVAQLSDKIVIVVRWGATARELVKECVGKISEPRKIAGVAFNRVNEHLAQKYGKYGYSYYYGNRYYNKYYES